ncbi:MAG TPA: LacI family DNA-binding transcriptional regulator [Terracidiphilus sp.]|jgi:DNA-binding LacI/PurR family transcriptional regulator
MRKSDKTARSTSSAPTVKEVARQAGVSTATVSRALSGSAGVREPLRSRIIEAARLLSYRPNRAARDLRVRSSRAVGVLIPDIENPFFTSLVCGIEDVLSKTDYSLLLASYNEDPEQESRRLEVFRAEGVCGLIFAASRTPSSVYSELEKDGLALVAVSRSIPRLRADEVTVASRDGAYVATSHLIQLGHKRIALINGPTALTTARDRQAGYEDALRDAGMNLKDELVVHCAFKQAAGRAAMEQLLKLTKPPTAVFAASNLLTLGALQAIHERNLVIPSQIAVVGFDDMPWAMSLRPPLTTIAQPAFEAGRTGAEMLLARVRDPSLPRRQVVLETRLIVRASCGSDSAHQVIAPRRKR